MRGEILIRLLGRALCLLMICGLQLRAGVAPLGNGQNGLQFDALITEVSLKTHRRIVLFARYWVSRESYAMKIVWAEPQGRGLDFPGYPVGLSVRSNPDRFRIIQEAYSGNDYTFQKPLAGRDVLRSMFGFYPNENMRFAESEALFSRLYATNFVKTSSGTTAINDSSNRVEIESRDSRVRSIRFFDKRQNLLKRVAYEYDDTGKIRRENVLLGEQPTVVGFQGKGMKVGINGSTNVIRELETSYHKGSRNCVVNYENVRLGGETVSLPTWIEVRRAEDDVFLHSVIMTNFQKFDPADFETEKGPERFACLTKADRDYRSLLSKYWMTRISKIPKEDQERLRVLRDHFRTNIVTAAITVAEQLKRLNTIMDLERLLEDVRVEQTYRRYLMTLTTNGLSELILTGGYSRIEASMLWGRIEEANALLQLWLEFADKAVEIKYIQEFTTEQLARNEFWPAAQLLARFSQRSNLTPSLCFDLKIDELGALRGAHKLLDPLNSKATNTLALAQIRWIRSSVNSGSLDTLIKAKRKAALKVFSEVERPTDAQKIVAKQLQTD